jgi:hypothetical protein
MFKGLIIGSRARDRSVDGSYEIGVAVVCTLAR